MDDFALAADILLELRDRVAAGGEGSLYGDRNEALRDLDRLIQSPSVVAIQGLLAPTANLQELSMECGWGAEFNILAARLEKALGIA